MLAAITLIGGLGYWDEARESEHALDDFALEQATLASSVGVTVRAWLDAIHDSGANVGVPPRLLANVRSLERPGELVVLLRPPGSEGLYTTDGRAIRSLPILIALDSGLASVRLARNDAAGLGLTERTAFAGLARLEVEGLGRWGVAAVASARRERDRERRARFRLVLGVALAGGLVVAFGGIALRNLRAELELKRELAVSQARSELDERLARATRAAMMGTFAMGVTHEISTPLGVIAGRAEQLRSVCGNDARGVRAAQAVLDQAERIKTLIRAFLDLARGGPPALVRVPSAVVAEEAVSLTAHRFEKARVHLRVDLASDLPVILCDRALLEHALVNLLLNSCEASDAGEVVELAARTDGKRVEFVVNDNGSGITPENVSRVTEPFFTTKKEGKGTGLGLAIATEIVKSHRGTLTIEARTPRGTRAAIEIPVAPEEARHAA